MTHSIHCLIRPCLIIALLTGSLHAGVTGIDSVTLGPGNELLSATVAGTVYDGGTIADSAADNSDGSMGSFDASSPLAAGSTAPTGSTPALSSVFDNDVLTGLAGGAGGDQVLTTAIALRQAQDWPPCGFCQCEQLANLFLSGGLTDLQW